MELLINAMLKAGARRERLTAKAFGGGSVLPGMPTVRIGEANGAFIREFLKIERIPLLAQDLLGDYPRKVYFYADTGEVRIKYLRTLANDTIARREVDYAAAFASESPPEVDIYQ